MSNVEMSAVYEAIRQNTGVGPIDVGIFGALKQLFCGSPNDVLVWNVGFIRAWCFRYMESEYRQEFVVDLGDPDEVLAANTNEYNQFLIERSQFTSEHSQFSIANHSQAYTA